MQSKGKHAKRPKGGTNPKEEPRLKEEPPTRKLRGSKPTKRIQEAPIRQKGDYPKRETKRSKTLRVGQLSMGRTVVIRLFTV
uniref:Uncharacterized protein n=1 Tax=Tanacetum cinerariifolium TaxID=118510 RepID=A0A699H8Q5_TANCI|nr:hypothetical protein [Tanacetum cinerariifolium]